MKYQVTVVVKIIRRVHKQNLSLVLDEEAVFKIYVTTAFGHLSKKRKKLNVHFIENNLSSKLVFQIKLSADLTWFKIKIFSKHSEVKWFVKSIKFSPLPLFVVFYSFATHIHTHYKLWKCFYFCYFWSNSLIIGHR